VKVIAVRIKMVLSKVISCKKFRFLRGRLIHEAIGTSQEGVHFIKMTQYHATILKLDLSKAYD
jgi:hypothetical protein